MTQTQTQIKPENQISQTENISRESIKNFIEKCESNHQQKLEQLAEKITNSNKPVSAITISGPSSSGKTTFSKQLAKQLQINGTKITLISMDDYFVDRENTPTLPNGKPDYEHIDAVEIALLHKNIEALKRGETVETPLFDFKAGRRSKQGKILKDAQNTIFIVEGIHALNPRTSEALGNDEIFKIYVPNQFAVNRNWRQPTSPQILRQNSTRISGLKTIVMWKSVRAGENRWIFPFISEADTTFNTSLEYEIGVLKPYITPLLKTIIEDQESKHSGTASRLINWLENFPNTPSTDIPKNSLLREFIGANP